MRIVVILAKHAESVIKRFPTACIHMAVQAPRSTLVIETRPGPAHYDLRRIFASHLLIEMVQIVFTPIAAVGHPLLAGVHPRIFTIEVFCVLRGWIVFVDQPGGSI